MAGAQYGLDSAELTKIINATDDAFGRMNQLNSRVEAVRQQLAVANQSQSGVVQGRKFDVWREDFHKISSRLQELNMKVKDLLRTGQSTADSATDHASR